MASHPRHTKSGRPAAREGDVVFGTDTHTVMIPSPGGAVPTPTPMPFQGTLSEGLSDDVLVEDHPAATKGSGAQNSPAHVPAGGPFQKPPTNRGRVESGSGSVFINDKPAARAGDRVVTCSDPADAPNGVIVATSTVLIGE